MTRAAFRHLRQRAASASFSADRASWVQFWRWAPGMLFDARAKWWTWGVGAPVVKRGQKR
jgi:hypothetical protein